MTRYEILQRFVSDGRTHRDHAFTFHVLTEMWMTAGKPDPFTPDFEEVLRLVRTSRRNLFRWVVELETFGFISYERRKNQHGKSVVSFVGHVQHGTAGSLVMSSVAQHEQSARVQDGTATNLPVSNLVQQTSGCVQNGTAESGPERQKRGIDDVSTSAEPVLVYNNNHLTNELSSNSKGDKEGDYDGKRVQGKNQTNRKLKGRHSAKSIGCKFTESPLADIVTFREAFASDTTAQAADLDHYHARLLNWRDKKGNIPERADWLATAKTFLLNDYREGKLVTVTTTVKPLHNAKSNNHSRSAVIEPESTTGRRFGSW